MGFLCVRMYLFILYYTLLSQIFEHLLLKICIVIVIIMYHNVLITSYPKNRTSKAKCSEIKESNSVYCLLVRCSKCVFDFSKIHI